MMKIAHTSDSHGQHKGTLEAWLKELSEQEDPPKVLVHSGDFMRHSLRPDDILEFIDWFIRQPFEHKILIPGNHDRWCEQFEKNESLRNEAIPDGLHFLINEEVIIDGFKFWGSPYTPEFNNWAFQLYGDEGVKLWESIPDDTDVLITHGPQKGILDTTGEVSNPGNKGCEHLSERIKELDIKAHLFGHIHGGYGIDDSNGDVLLNSSLLNERYEATNRPQVCEIKY
jgi:Icc-related predicted phosphoesterase